VNEFILEFIKFDYFKHFQTCLKYIAEFSLNRDTHWRIARVENIKDHSIMKIICERRNFNKTSVVSGIGFGVSESILPLYSIDSPLTSGQRLGIIGLDTSHCVAFTKELNSIDESPKLGGYKIMAAYPKGSLDIESSVSRIPGYIEEVKKMGVEIVDSIPSFLKKVDVVLLETNDGRRHLEQAIPVLKAGKPMFIDKPIAASLSDAMVIVQTSKYFKAPFFSSSLRFMPSAQEVVNGKIGKVIGADVYSPFILEKTSEITQQTQNLFLELDIDNLR